MGHLGPDLVVPIEHTRDNLECPWLSWDRWDILDLGLVVPCIHHGVDSTLMGMHMLWFYHQICM